MPKKKKSFTIAIAGAGPAGLLLARDLARAGMMVTVYEKRTKGAKGHDWSDAIEYGALREAGFDMPVAENGNYRGRLVKKTAGPHLQTEGRRGVRLHPHRPGGARRHAAL